MPEAKKPRCEKQDARNVLAESAATSRDESLQSSTTPSNAEQTGENAVTDTQTQAQNAATPLADAATPDAGTEINRLKADIVITRHVAVAAGAGLIPIPLVDFAAISGVQLSMLAQICGIYEKPFSKEAAKTIIASLVGGVIGGEASALAIGSRLKFVPVVGTVASWLVSPAASAVTTYAIGKVFVHHLENGGSLLTFEAQKMKECMERALAEGKKLVPHWGTPAATVTPDPAPSA
jgi:uncharacterized protein (DUF697 family)